MFSRTNNFPLRLMTVFVGLLTAILVNARLVAQSSEARPQNFSVTFSNVQPFSTPPGQDMDVKNALVGVELSLKVRGTKVSAVLKEYEGTELPKVSRMEGTLVDTEISLQGTKKPSKVAIIGNIGAVLFSGTIRHVIGKQTISSPITLKLVLRPKTCCVAA